MKQYKASIYEFEDSWINQSSVEQRIARSKIIRQYPFTTVYKDRLYPNIYLSTYELMEPKDIALYLEDAKQFYLERLPYLFRDATSLIICRYLSETFVMLNTTSTVSHLKCEFLTDYTVNAWL